MLWLVSLFFNKYGANEKTSLRKHQQEIKEAHDKLTFNPSYCLTGDQKTWPIPARDKKQVVMDDMGKPHIIGLTIFL